MSEADEIKKAWANLNGFEDNSKVNIEIADSRRLDYKDPVLNKLDSTQFMVQTMTGRLERIERRLNILYWIWMELLSFRKLIELVLLFGGLAGIAALMYGRFAEI